MVSDARVETEIYRRREATSGRGQTSAVTSAGNLVLNSGPCTRPYPTTPTEEEDGAPEVRATRLPGVYGVWVGRCTVEDRGRSGNSGRKVVPRTYGCSPVPTDLRLRRRHGGGSECLLLPLPALCSSGPAVHYSGGVPTESFCPVDDTRPRVRFGGPQETPTTGVSGDSEPGCERPEVSGRRPETEPVIPGFESS